MKTILIYITGILTIISLNVEAQNIDKALKNMEKGDFLKAREVLQKNLLDDSLHVPSNFCMALVLSDEKNPEQNVIDSWYYVTNVLKDQSAFSAEDLEALKEYFYNVEVRKTSRPPQKKIELAIEKMEDQLIKYIREENDLDGVYKVLKRYPDYKHYDNVIHIRNQFEFRKYEKMNTVEGYTTFIEKFPDAAQIDKAKKNIYKIALENAKKENTEAAFNNYIEKYPESMYVQQAIILRNAAAYKHAEETNSMNAYESFVLNYPEALQIIDAKKNLRELLYQEAKRVKTLDAYNRFIALYPEGAYFVDVFNLKTEALGKQYAQKMGFNTETITAKAYDNNGAKDAAKAFCKTYDGGIVMAGNEFINDTLSGIWMLKLGNDGKLLWQSEFGKEDSVLVSAMYTVDNDEILVVTKSYNNEGVYMYQLTRDGKRKWKRPLDLATFDKVTQTGLNKILFIVSDTDTIPDSCTIAAFEMNGLKKWDKSFSQPGAFIDVTFGNNKNCLLLASRWLAYTDSLFYIKWEDTLTMGKYFIKGAVGANEIFTVVTDSTSMYFQIYNLDGALQKEVKFFETLAPVYEIYQLRNGVYLIPVKYGNTTYLLQYDSSGKVAIRKKITSEIDFVSLIENEDSSVYYLFSTDDMLLIKE